VYDLSNGGADLDTALVTKWGQASGRTQEAAQLLGTLGQLSGDIASGRVKVVNDPNPPSQ
jgi:hypothetical protein